MKKCMGCREYNLISLQPTYQYDLTPCEKSCENYETTTTLSAQEVITPVDNIIQYILTIHSAVSFHFFIKSHIPIIIFLFS